MSKRAKVAPVTQEEQDLRVAQTDLLKQQREIVTEQLRVQDLLSPILYKQAGVTPQFDSSGKIVGFTEQTDELSDMRDAIEKGLMERSLAALQGNLPVSPTLERELAKQEELTRASLQKQLGTGYETSSAGILTLGDLFQRGTELREASRRGELTAAESMGLARGSNTAMLDAQTLQNVFGVTGQGWRGSEGITSALGGYGGMMGVLGNDRALQTQANIQNAQSSNALWQSIGGIAGGALTGGLMGVGGLGTMGSIFAGAGMGATGTTGLMPFIPKPK